MIIPTKVRFLREYVSVFISSIQQAAFINPFDEFV